MDRIYFLFVFELKTDKWVSETSVASFRLFPQDNFTHGFMLTLNILLHLDNFFRIYYGCVRNIASRTRLGTSANGPKTRNKDRVPSFILTAQNMKVCINTLKNKQCMTGTIVIM